MVEAREPSSTTSTVFANVLRISFAPLLVSLPSATPALRARKRCRVSEPIPDSWLSVRAAKPTRRQPFFPASVLARASIFLFPVPA